MIDITQLTRRELYELRLAVQNNIDQYEEAAMSALKLGIPVDGYELKKGRKSRKIKDEKALVAELTAEGIPFGDLYQTKLKGIPALEKLVAKADRYSEVLNAIGFKLSQHIEVTTGDPTLQYVGDIPDETDD